MNHVHALSRAHPQSVSRRVRHEEWIQAGHLTDALEAKAIHYIMTAIDQNELVPESVHDISGLALLGSTYSVNDGYSRANDEITLIKKVLDA